MLINKLGIEDAEKLHIAEREITSLRIANAKLSVINIAKGNMFCNYEYIEANADSLFNRLRRENYLKDASEEEIPSRLAYYLSEINVLHPFREGNGRAQRLFIEYLAENAGYNVGFSQVTDRQMIEASAASFLCDYTKMNELFSAITSSLQETTMTQTFTE